MKRIYLSIMLCSFVLISCKQKAAVIEPADVEPIESKTPKSNSSASQEMYHLLEMSNEQRAEFIKIKEKYQKLRRSSIRGSQANSEGMKEKMETIRAKQEAELQGLFSPEQYVLYLEWLNDNN